jgi:DNA polymerase I
MRYCALQNVTLNLPRIGYLAKGEDDSELIKEFVKKIERFDPDVIVGFETNTRNWAYLFERCKARKIKLAVGRDGSEPHNSAFGHVSIAGRSNLDIFDIARDMPEVKVKTIKSIAEYLQVPSAKKLKPIEEFQLHELWTDAAGKKSLIEHTMSEAQALIELADATLNYPIQLSAVTGLPLDQVMVAAVGFRVDSYLIKQAHGLGELIPSKVEQPFYPYRGALVLEPKTGVHENIVVLDFTSMYPNLMKNYNLSPDTFVKPSESVPEDSVSVIPEVNYRFRKKPLGLYTVAISRLIDMRQPIQKSLSELQDRSTRFKVLVERERAVKVVTNACYGYAGWAGARWYAKEVAESATALGRDVINRTIEKAKSIGLDVIYGDTDSVFVKDDRKLTDKLGEWAKTEFNLDIKREKEYERVLFTEAMKRYAGLLRSGELDTVGLEVVRGDWSDIARQVQELVLLSILKDESPEKAVQDVSATITRLRNGQVPIDDLAIRKTLTKRIEDYAVRTPHVEVARLLVKEGWYLTVGDKVAYVITKGRGSKLFEKAKPINQVKLDDVDVEYYIDNQIKPAAMRILERFGVTEKQIEA